MTSIISADRAQHAAAFDAIAESRHGDPFAVLGAHRSGDNRIVRTLQPGAKSVDLLDRHKRVLCRMEQVHGAGIFTGVLPSRLRRYLFGIDYGDGFIHVVEDIYRFGPSLPEHSQVSVYDRFGAHVCQQEGIAGTRFAVWAPNAFRVSVVGDFNHWDGRRHVMRRHPESGIWEMFIPHIGSGCLYKYELLDAGGKRLPLKSDPYAHAHEAPPGNASVVFASNYTWHDQDWLQHQRVLEPRLNEPMSIYEVHLGSWRRNTTEHNRRLTYRELAKELVDYVREMGFTHVELMPVTEHPFDGSWGYQPIGMYAPTHRFGSPDDFRFLVDSFHQAGIGVIVDWVAAHFPRDEHGLRRFDGTALYEYDDPRKAEHLDWGTLIYNYGRWEVVEYLLGTALYWIEHMHVDGLRVDAVASMLYLDYSRKGGEWVPNEHGGNQNLEAVAFLRRLNELVHARGAITLAEESTAWPGVSRPVYAGGLGFTYKWNLGWMNDTLDYMSEEPVHRKHHHDRMTFGLVYAFNENFVLPLSHDEVVHGKRSLIGRMPGDEWQRFANYRAYLAFMFCHPGKKLLFMGAEIAQLHEWNHNQSLDWHLLDKPLHAGVQQLIQDLNRTHRELAALHELDFVQGGFSWLNSNDRDQSVYAWLRYAGDGSFVVCIVNFTPVIRYDYGLVVPQAGDYAEILNTDARAYGGSGAGNLGKVHTDAEKSTDTGRLLRLTLPPLAMLILQPVGC